MEVHAHTHTAKKKMDTLFLGVSHVVPCSILWFFSRESREHYVERERAKEWQKNWYKEI